MSNFRITILAGLQRCHAWPSAPKISEWDVHPSLPEGEGEGEEHQHGSEVIHEVLEFGEMPPATYLLFHPEARLTDKEFQILYEGLPKSIQE